MKVLALILATLLGVAVVGVVWYSGTPFEDGVAYVSRYYLQATSNDPIRGWETVRFSHGRFVFSYVESSSRGISSGEVQGEVESQVGPFMVLKVVKGARDGASQLTSLRGDERLYLDREYVMTPGNTIHVVSLPQHNPGVLCFYSIEFRALDCKTKY